MIRKAVILNSGTGSRMGSLTADQPKCLVEVAENETILQRQLEALENLGFREVLITTGPFEEKIKEHLAGKFSGFELTYVNNPRYAETNYIYSLLLAGPIIEQDILLLHGDLVFEEAVLEKILCSEHDNAVLVNPFVKLPDKDFKAEIENGRVRKIGIDLFSRQSVFLVPIYKLSRETFSRWLEEMKAFQEKGRLKVYAENALNNLLGELTLHPVEFKDEFCTEIDDLEDYEKVKAYLAGLRRNH